MEGTMKLKEQKMDRNTWDTNKLKGKHFLN